MSKVKEKKPVKKFDAVKEMRKIRDEISLEIADMNYEQMKAYFKTTSIAEIKVINSHWRILLLT